MMISLTEELVRLRDVPEDIPNLPVGNYTVDLLVTCEISPEIVINLSRSVLISVLDTILFLPDAVMIEDGDTYRVDQEFWSSRLPNWFISATPFHDDCVEKNTPETWTLDSWLYWFIESPDDRAWRWWTYRMLSKNTCIITLQVADLPMPWEALRWLLQSAGASSVSF
jgi:hypothetical protein